MPGGGVALVRAIKALEKTDLEGEEQLGVNIVRRALEEPVRQIAANAGFEGSVVVRKVMGAEGRFSDSTRKRVDTKTLLKAGIIDPTKVTRFALQKRRIGFGASHDHRGHGGGQAG